MKKTIPILMSLLIFHSVLAANIGQSLNPGIKIGYEFGNNPGFVIGAEISYVFITNKFLYFGPVLGISRNSFSKKLSPYFEGELGFGPIGTSLGCKWDDYLKFKMRFFVGAFGYFSYAIIPEDNSSEISGIIKVPLIVKDPQLQIFDFDFHLNIM